jgi:hypothetical protein
MKSVMKRREFLASLGLAIPLTHVATKHLFGALAGVVPGGFEVGSVGAPPDIVTSSESPLTTMVCYRLGRYLAKLTGKTPNIGKVVTLGPSQILLGDASLAREYGVVPPQVGEECFTLAPVRKGGRSFVIVSGQSDLGIKRGVYSLLQNLRVEGHILTIPEKTIQFQPFLVGRAAHLDGYVRQVFNLKHPNGSGPETIATREQLAWDHWEDWELERISDYIQMLDFFGYNLIESEGSAFIPEGGASPLEQANVTQRRDIFLDSIRRCGMHHRVFFDGTLMSKDGQHIPYGPDTRQLYEEYYRTNAEAIAPYADSVITHWLDDGGWPSTPEHPCTIEVLQMLHMEIHQQFRRVNPKIETVLSLWALDQAGPGTDNLEWHGYTGVETIVKSGLIPKEVGIAMGGTVRLPEARQIAAAGHSASVWGWYLADNELVYTMHVHTHVLANYFSSLPEEAHDLIGLHTLDSCQEETNLYSIYVGAQMLANPGIDPEVYLREVARLVYGPKVENAVFQGLKAIADVRCGKHCTGYWNPAAKPGFGAATHTTNEVGNRGHSELTNGVVSFDEGLRQATAAWDGLKSLDIDQSYTPPIRFHRPVTILLRELKGHVEAIAKYMQFLKDRQTGKQLPTEVPTAEGPFEYYERIEYLTPGAVFWPATVFLPK